ncbi:glycoside hydrolase family 10 protein [Telluria aromaticivorans]|uniref:Family 10 glycosylhydrolase n=1 Tax=Telluria aromaticivorans TaxID=2725995 RepID=A0A7Y2P2H0_9BURK|nr:family 10 glycosylhydrolase [Telluria aromaticivorans]NNG24929.1 family 10 glycosylhydrolase [Telluria aromaticivorans]
MKPDLKKRALTLAGLTGALALGGLMTACTTQPGKPGDQADMPPPAPREFRAAWVSTVANIDWPSKPGLPSAQQQQEAIAILDRAVSLKLNAIVLQVRPAADAIYPSKIEPWTEYLNGAQGKPPQPFYDPLKFWVTEAHARGLELHAWFNPYRARHDNARSPAAPNHITNTIPSAVKRYGKFMWMDPGEEAASKQTMDVILDVVRRYDIDGVHIDDYFYPYPIEAPDVAGNASALDGNGNGKAAAKPELDFPDTPAWERYLQSGGKLDRPSWRRDNVNRLIESMYKGIHREKSWVRFGISPFGLGRPDRRPPGINGFSQYDKLYADAELWLQNGWVDYFTPQLYWAIAPAAQSYPVLLDYWIGQNTQGRHMWPGLFTSRIGAPAPTKQFEPDEILQQIAVTRARPLSTGHVHFSMVALTQNRKGISDQLRATTYAGQALVPATTWLSSERPGMPQVSSMQRKDGVSLTLKAGKGTALYAIWARHGGEWRFAVAPASRVDWTVPDDARLGAANLVYVSAVDRLGNEGAPVQAWRKPK